jgi:beta-1,2-mannobiose phosphorylase / 1,2-beta-oligomannan phosphorylase
MKKQTMILTVERLYDGAPLLQKVENHAWENKVTFNPACVLISDKKELSSIISSLPFDWHTKDSLRSHSALCFLLYRAQGAKTKDNDHTPSTIGLAVLDPEMKLLARYSKPVMVPEESYENLGVEDPRITKIGTKYIMMYAAYSSATPENAIRIALASTTDFIHWKKHGLLKAEFNQINNKNAMLFPSKIDGKFIMLHRPMEGADAMTIHWAESDDIFGEWKSRGVLMKPAANKKFSETWIGGGAPPLPLSDGRYLIIYHIGNRKSDATREYDLGIAIFDSHSKDLISHRHEPFLQPESPFETKGDANLGVNNVVFICGAYFYKGTVYFPYAGADSVILRGKIRKNELDQYLAL